MALIATVTIFSALTNTAPCRPRPSRSSCSAKVVTSTLGAKAFDRERFGLIGSIILPSACVFGAGTHLPPPPLPPPPTRPSEVLVSPLHLAMVRVQSGISPSVASALVAAVTSSGALGPWNGAWAFALKVSTASHILHCVVPFAFYFRRETRSLATCHTV
jgi:hypothetical protein